MERCRKYIIDYGFGAATLYTPGDPEERFYTLANTCFGIRKSIACCNIIAAAEKTPPAPAYERLEFNGDVYIWREDGARKMLAPYPDEEWDTDYCQECAPHKEEGTVKTNENLQQLLQLMTDHPELPVVPMVQGEVCGSDDCCYWLGAWHHSEIERYMLGEERIYFYDESDMEEPLTEAKGWDWYENASENEALEAYAALPWVDCIAVYISYPEV